MANTLGANQPFRYRGYVYDTETGWYYLQSRYYNPETCRFVSADIYLSTGQGVLGHNSYTYCGNNPVILEDNGGCAAHFCNVYATCDGGVGLWGGGFGSGVRMPAPAAPISPAKVGKGILDTILLILGIKATQSVSDKTKAETKTETKEKTKEKEKKGATYYGVVLDKQTNALIKVSGSMNFVTAVAWVKATDIIGEISSLPKNNQIIGKSRSWGLYTESQTDAYLMAAVLGMGKPIQDFHNGIRYYYHYHVYGHVLFGKYKHFHIWYGNPSM